ncbi:hypothetical protein B0I72DRAFT_11261 [Yarrowia lipolytica]|uniref:Uncharacterized protein n=1 Tax=Yarrowia lipolytica TaxID=4952 RepID=A0A371C006_YARLL|nr:hypothetical protein B0I71DRAFT_13528 [Yarrowia lipolytica]RDW30342.1 hypothetical protein B0I72DRAFT_11261 [Yarrowia lipolytica]RDW43413.1 hypothetical protein B0I74DRAFT_10270 [Yarrowia lipolytica]RDW50204.1 hypothetical protein B0I75DRAFT_8428 [Yarrowia lipolytica]
MCFVLWVLWMCLVVRFGRFVVRLLLACVCYFWFVVPGLLLLLLLAMMPATVARHCGLPLLSLCFDFRLLLLSCCLLHQLHHVFIRQFLIPISFTTPYLPVDRPTPAPTVHYP